jgi:diguanylate cyclase (GGDEF)-like protein
MNARVFRETVEHELYRSARYERPITLAFIDIDGFKVVNDVHGHRVGDAVLRSLGAGLERCTRKTDVVARLGGDEFAILLPETGQEAARTSIEKVRECLREAMQSRIDVAVTFSVGVVTCDDGECTADELIQAADAMMYSVKQHGKDGVRFSGSTDS